MSEITTVYHYCSLDTLLSILDKKTIRLSDINKSNDYLETKATIGLIKNAVINLCHKDSIDEYEQIMLGTDNKAAMVHLIEIVFNRLLNYNEVLVYVACFSEESDLLSQWCEYANGGKGVAIGFNTECIKKICKSSEGFLKFDKVTYLNKDNSSFDEMINRYAKQFYGEIIDALVRGRLDNLFNNPYGSDSQAMRDQNQLATESALVKHESFSAEAEWRIVLEDEDLLKSSNEWDSLYNWKESEALEGIQKLIPKALQFRSIGDNIISFVDLSFENYISDIIDCIVIGPNCKAQPEEIYQLVQHFGFWNIEEENIFVSKSSYKLKV